MTNVLVVNVLSYWNYKLLFSKIVDPYGEIRIAEVGTSYKYATVPVSSKYWYEVGLYFVLVL